MRARRANPQQVKLHRSYSVSELAKRLGVHKNTVRLWQRNGLKPIDTTLPALFQGAHVRAFLAERNARRKRPCKPGTLFCFQCRTPRQPALAIVDYSALTATSGNLRAICEVCGGIMHQRIRRADLATKLPGLPVQIREASIRISGSTSSFDNCDSEKQVTK